MFIFAYPFASNSVFNSSTTVTERLAVHVGLAVLMVSEKRRYE